jgi:CRP/FNR family transcriptional regulator
VQATFKKGEIIFKENALSSNIIYLQSGLVKLTKEGSQRTQILNIRKGPCYLGLPTTMGDKINHYSAIAIEDSTACFVDISIFKQLLNLNPSFSYDIIVELCKNELLQFNRCVKLVQSQVYGRLAGNLIYFSQDIYNSDEYILPFNRNELADLVCTSRESVSRVLSELTEEKIISLKGKSIKILNKDLLEKISEKG